MKKQSPFFRYTWVFSLICLLLISCGVTSRYRLDLFVASEDVRKKVHIETSEITANSILNDPYHDFKVVPGRGNVAVVTVTARWSQQESEKLRLLDFDEYWRCKLFLKLNEPLEAGTMALKENSFLQLLGRYDVSAEDKIFIPTDGSCTVDSLNSKSVFFTIDGKYANRKDESLEFSGQFKISRPD